MPKPPTFDVIRWLRVQLTKKDWNLEFFIFCLNPVFFAIRPTVNCAEDYFTDTAGTCITFEPKRGFEPYKSNVIDLRTQMG